MYASTAATCPWTASRVMGFPRSASRASPLGALLTPAKGTNVAPPSPVLTCGECTNAGTYSHLTEHCSTYTLIILAQKHVFKPTHSSSEAIFHLLTLPFFLGLATYMCIEPTGPRPEELEDFFVLKPVKGQILGQQFPGMRSV